MREHSTFFLSTVLAVLVAVGTVDAFKRNASDPLQLSNTDQQEHYVKRAGEEFTFTRHACAAQDLTVSVHREFYDIDNGKKFMLPAISYGAYAKDGCFDVEFATLVPLRIPAGRYEYRPLLIYRVNELLQINKPAPGVFVDIIE